MMTRHDYTTRVIELCTVADKAIKAGDTDAALVLMAEIVDTVLKHSPPITAATLARYRADPKMAGLAREFGQVMRILDQRGLSRKTWQ